MNMCNYVQNLFEAYLVVTNALHYNFSFIYKTLSMSIGGSKVVALSLDESELKMPIIEYIGSYIGDIKDEYDYNVKIAIDYRLRPEVDVKYL